MVAAGMMRFSNISKRIARRSRCSCHMASFFARKISLRLFNMAASSHFAGRLLHYWASQPFMTMRSSSDRVPTALFSSRVFMM